MASRNSVRDRSRSLINASRSAWDIGAALSGTMAAMARTNVSFRMPDSTPLVVSPSGGPPYRFQLGVDTRGTADEEPVTGGTAGRSREDRADRLPRPEALAAPRNVAHGGVFQPARRVANRHSPAGVNDRLADSVAAFEGGGAVERRQGAARAGSDMCGKERHRERSLGDLDGRRPPWVHFDRIEDAVPLDEIDSVETNESKRRGDELRYVAGRIEHCGAVSELRVAGRSKDAAAIAKAAGAEVRIAHELA